MNFMEAVKAMKEGKKVKRGATRVFHKQGSAVVNEKNEFIEMLYDDFEATDWEIVEETKEIKLEKRSFKESFRYVIDQYLDGKLDMQQTLIQLQALENAYEDKKSLSDKIMCIEEVHKMYDDMSQQESIDFDKDLLFDKDVKKAIGNFISIMSNVAILDKGTDIMQMAEEAFGERLI